MIIKPLKFAKPTAELRKAGLAYGDWCALGIGGYWEIEKIKARGKMAAYFELTTPNAMSSLVFDTREDAEKYANLEHAKAIRKMVTP